MEQFDIVQNEILLKKSLELELKKNIFIVEFHKPEDFLSINQNNKVLDNNSKISNLKLICKGSECSFFFNPTLAFISAIEAQGYYWGENPLGKEPKITEERYKSERHFMDNNPEDSVFGDHYADWSMWQEAESKTFNLNNTSIFFKL